MKLVVNGGSGFIGSNFVRYLLNRYPDCRITNVNALTYAGSLACLRSIEGYPDHRFVKADVVDREAMERVC